MEGGQVGIKINDIVGQNFQIKKGVRQGDLLSPILFNIVVYMLAILINRAKGEGQMVRAFQSFNMQMIQYYLWSIILSRQRI
jgi:hypothetical protein